MHRQLHGEVRETESLFERARALLRRVMPRVAVGAALMCFVWLLVGNTAVYRSIPLSGLYNFLTFIAVSFTILYYGLKALRWLKRRLLWRVRRRLIITYLFVGLTPIILMTLLALLAGFGGSSQALSRIVAAEVELTEKQTLESARAMADAAAHLPAGTDDKAFQAWLDERAALLRAALPGARVAVWRGGATDDPSSVGQNSSAQFVSDLSDEQARGVGDKQTPVGAQLPQWLKGKTEWGDLAYSKSNNPQAIFGSPSLRALVRTTSGGRPFAFLVVVPMSHALVEQYRATTGIYLRPYFITSAIVNRKNRVTVNAGNSNQSPVMNSERDNPQAERQVEEMLLQDQFGEPIKQSSYFVVLPGTNWETGENRDPKTGEINQHLTFLFDWSFDLARKQFLGSTNIGEFWRRALIIVAVVFLLFELLALAAAAWMTRAVTGTVHKLYRATEFIKRGDFSHRVKVRSRDQLGELAEAFNEMSANIEGLLQERVARERLEREVEIAAEVQAQLFPRRVPDLLTAEISAECRAARGVAGDYYDYIEIAPGLVALALGDVSGKGISASLVMSNLQASLRAQTTITAERMSLAESAVRAAASNDTSSASSSMMLAQAITRADIDGAVSRKLTNINQQLCQSTESNRFATLFLAIYEDRTRALRYSNAGHNPPILVRSDGTVERLTTGGMMAGAFEWAHYDEAKVTLNENDLLLVFSDGISEAQAPETEEEYGEERLVEFAVRHRNLPADALRQAIFREIDAWSGNQERGDDQTLVIVKGIK